MNLYDRCVLPRLINFAMTRDEVTRLRAAHVPAARGVVLEVGIGSGLNLPFYTSAVTQLYGVDPSARAARDGARRSSGGAVSGRAPQRRTPIGIPLARRVGRHGRRHLVAVLDRQCRRRAAARCGAC